MDEQRRKERGVAQARCCYTCAMSMFRKKDVNRTARAKGICLGSVPAFPRTWAPPDAFWADVQDAAFPVGDFETFRRVQATYYYGHAAAAHVLTEAALREEFDRLNWIAGRPDEICFVSWLETCPDHRFPEEAGHETQQPG